MERRSAGSGSVIGQMLCGTAAPIGSTNADVDMMAPRRREALRRGRLNTPASDQDEDEGSREENNKEDGQRGERRYDFRERTAQQRVVQQRQPEEEIGGPVAHKRRRVSTLDGSEKGSDANPRGNGNENEKEAEIQTHQVDDGVSFDDVGGHSECIRDLKEMVMLPLLCPNFFEGFGMTPPRGILLCGPPGTGKTLIARAMASAVSKQAGKKVSFYMRKGADVLSKWVGEAEQQLKLLFEEAQRNQPSIIFFDEIDGLAPARSSRQEQAYNSVVSTLLALMDGIDSRGEVVLIGATNRVDTIDGALRRPGRFDREYNFTLPGVEARAEILDIHSRKWKHPPSNELRRELAASCVGYCGADLKALCTEAAMCAFREKYPQVYSSTDCEFDIDVDSVRVEKNHFIEAMSRVTPAAHRGAAVHSRPLSPVIAPCLQRQLKEVKSLISDIFPPFKLSCGSASISPPVCRPRLLLCGSESYGLDHLAPAVLHELSDKFPIHSIGVASLLSDPNAKTPEEALVHIFGEAMRRRPSVLYLPHLELWWKMANEQLRTVLLTLLKELPSDSPVLLLVTSPMTPAELVDINIEELSRCSVYNVKRSTKDRHLFVDRLIKAAFNQVSDGPPDNATKQIKSLMESFKRKTLKFSIPLLETTSARVMNGIFGMKNWSEVFNYLQKCVEDNV